MSNRDFTDDYMEGLLRDHFKAEVADQPASSNPWDWLKTRLESTPNPFPIQRVSAGYSSTHGRKIRWCSNALVAAVRHGLTLGVGAATLIP